jgi:hypothetical protein
MILLRDVHRASVKASFGRWLYLDLICHSETPFSFSNGLKRDHNLVKAELRYADYVLKSEGCGFDSRWGHWISFDLILLAALWSLTEMSTKNLHESKGRPATSPPSVSRLGRTVVFNRGYTYPGLVHEDFSCCRRIHLTGYVKLKYILFCDTFFGWGRSVV